MAGNALIEPQKARPLQATRIPPRAAALADFAEGPVCPPTVDLSINGQKVRFVPRRWTSRSTARSLHGVFSLGATKPASF
jgi:hypothetical protein